ncbi:MAG: hypothetical protein OEZ58_07500 [Gammaproteobacteria bacterium]|nr:hypothetical protein [Gammaproteobacteria bacterium]MDH5728821.1 hypothetical protein [Gammaproteobacteria bacterium]
MQLKTCSYRAIVRSSGIFDIILMLPFAIPGVAAWTISQIGTLHYSLNLSGNMPEFSPFHLLFVNLMAIITIVWSSLRVITPSAQYGNYDTLARIFIAATMVIYLLAYNVSEILWLFVMVEVTWTVLQINAYFFKNQNREGVQAAAV